MEEQKRKNSLFGPLFLVFIGALLLLNNFGVVPWDIWFQLLRLWPLFLIGAGLDLLLGHRSMLGSLFSAVLIIALLAGGLWFLASRTPSQPAQTQQVSYALDDATLADIHIRFGVGVLRIGALSDSNDLLKGTLNLSKGEELQQEYNVKGSEAFLELGSKTPSIAFPQDWNKKKVWDLAINTRTQAKLKVDTGVGEADLDLQQLNLAQLDVNSGVGKTTVILPQKGQVTAKIKGGIAQVVIEIPAGMEIRLTAQVGLGGIDVPAGYQRDGNSYTSPGYSSAENRINMDVSGGIGRIVIRERPSE